MQKIDQDWPDWSDGLCARLVDLDLSVPQALHKTGWRLGAQMHIQYFLK